MLNKKLNINSHKCVEEVSFPGQYSALIHKTLMTQVPSKHLAPPSSVWSQVQNSSYCSSHYICILDSRTEEETKRIHLRCQRTNLVSHMPGDCSMTICLSDTASIAERSWGNTVFIFPPNRGVQFEGEVAHTEEHLVIFGYDCPIHSSAIYILSLFWRHLQCIILIFKQWLVIIFLKDEYLYTVKIFKPWKKH